MSEVHVFCSNCKEDILRADSEKLKFPLIGSMFTVKPGMEWDIFGPSATGNDLICPMCEWSFLKGSNGLLIGSLDLPPIYIFPREDGNYLKKSHLIGYYEAQCKVDLTPSPAAKSEAEKVEDIFQQVKRRPGRPRKNA